MAILKHIASKSSNYGAALEYLIFKHDELRKTPILDQNGNRIMRDEFYLDGLNCEPYSFDAACQQLNREYQKNENKDEIKSHHYIISFDPRDSTENCLTGKRAQELGLEYAKANFPGHQALVCTHMDGHNGSGNIHVHIVINSLRKLDVPKQPFMERPIDCKAGYKHHLTKDYLKYPKIVEYKSQNPIQTLYECSAILGDWRKRFAPKSAEEELHPCFVASLHYTDYIQYLIENRHFLTEHRKEVQQIAQRIRKYEIDHFQHPQNALAG